jgi:acetyltransferase-like isoleucine patch superfamily enzyme
LLGSNIYIGDHTHGPTKINIEIINVLPIPAKRELDNLGPIIIGARSWICDGVVILPNSRIHHDSIIAANSVVKLVTNRPALIAGAPAKIIRYLDEK